ncbi:chlororespiratory reduction protein 7 [[Phormidium] sp. ETS-05]|uniref:chlororespiratory reduction protein 7 n=1 Tax=[Phormidium] sp. ETS-05 TaxID=222819 RepID=UPI0018EF1328|nr:chlororespiratory reduction protein 7 [[Phormidium] sp. ETS-05]
MPNSLMYQDEDTFVLLYPDRPEEFFSASELREKLQDILAHLQDDLPRDLQKFTNLSDQAQHLLDNNCQLEIAPGQSLQWYAVRLEK